MLPFNEDIVMNYDRNAPSDGALAIDEGLFVEVNGIDQWLTLRGTDRANPAVLLLGGPGGAYSPLAPLYANWERHFTVVQWDQPGAGATQGKNGDATTGPLTIERLVRDAIAVLEIVRARLGKKRVAIIGFSGGSLLSLTIASRRPDLLSACVGSGQFVDWARQDAASYQLVLERLRALGDAAAVAELVEIGPPPYPDTATDAVKSKYAGAFTPAEAASLVAILPALQAPAADAKYVAPGVPLGDPRALALAAYDKLRADIVTFDARRLGRKFRVPMLFFQGEHDLFSVTADVRDYVDEIEAPSKLLAIIPGAGHGTFLMSAPLLDLMLEHVLPVAAEP
jgi:pimeloyl-ACP methyl ester carboxylesterase